MLLVFLPSPIDPLKSLNELMELEKKRSPCEYINALPAMLTMLLGKGGLATKLRHFAVDMYSVVSPTPQIPDIKTWSYFNTALAVEALILSAASFGLRANPIEGFDGRRISGSLNIPDRYAVPLVVLLGYPSPDASLKLNQERVRFALSTMCFEDSFGQSIRFRESQR
jgi:hypothetical protein